MYNFERKKLSKFVEKLLKYRIMYKDILTFLGLNLTDASLITLYFGVTEKLIEQDNYNI